VTNSPELARRISEGAPIDALTAAAAADGLRALWFAGVHHAAEGHTSIEELVRVLTPPAVPPVRSQTKPSTSQPSLVLASPAPIHAEVRAVLERFGYSWRAEPPTIPVRRAPDS
jgi:hypothetical protein